MVEDFKHNRYKDDARVRNAEVNITMGVSGTAGSLEMAQFIIYNESFKIVFTIRMSTFGNIVFLNLFDFKPIY